MAVTVVYEIGLDQYQNKFPVIYRVVKADEVEISKSTVLFNEVVQGAPDVAVSYLSTYKAYLLETSAAISDASASDLVSLELVSLVRALSSAATYVGEHADVVEMNTLPPLTSEAS